MYKAKLWDEDKWNIHSQSYGSSKYTNLFSEDKKDEKKYHEQKYGAKEKDEEKKEAFDTLEEEKKESEEIKEDEIPFKAAKQVFEESKHEPKKSRKDINSIEEAIKKAIEEEKKVVVMDN